MSGVAWFLMSFGVMLYPMALLTVVVLVLTVIAARRLLTGDADRRVRSGIDAILFWGAVTALLGFLGQWMGLYKMSQILLHEAPRVGLNPQAVGVGFAESLRTAIFGVGVLLYSLVAWLALHAWRRRLAERGRIEVIDRTS